MERKKFKNMGRGVYISLAICMLVVAAVGIFASIRSVSNLVTDNIEEVNKVTLPNDFTVSLVDSYDFAEEKEDNTQVLENVEIPAPDITYICPVQNREVVKRHSGGELVYSETMNDYRTHNGIDIAAESGDAVMSVAAGTIIKAEEDALWGMCVEVEHGNGIVTVYKNLDKTLPEGIEEGAFVESGGVIGAVSTSALVEIGEKTHLHFEVIDEGEYIDPATILNINE